MLLLFLLFGMLTAWMVGGWFLERYLPALRQARVSRETSNGLPWQRRYGGEIALTLLVMPAATMVAVLARVQLQPWLALIAWAFALAAIPFPFFSLLQGAPRTRIMALVALIASWTFFGLLVWASLPEIAAD